MVAPLTARPAERATPARALWLLGAVALAGGALRFATLDVQSIWLDESATMILVRRGLGGALSHLSSSESAPPLYYILAWAWTRVFGAGPLGFRSLSALAGTLTIPVMYLAGRRVSPKVGLWAAAITAVNPAMYYYSQEARAYALLVLFAACAFVLWQRALAQPSARNLALWALASSLAVLTHYFAAFLFVPEAVVLWRRAGWRRTRLAIGAVVLVGLALTPLALAERADNKASWIEAESLISRIAQTVKQFAVGLSAPLQILAAPAIVLLALGAVALLWRSRSDSDLPGREAARDAAIVVAAALALPLALAVTHLIDVFDGRNVIATWVPLALLIAAGLGVSSSPSPSSSPSRSVERARAVAPLLGAGICAVSLAVVVAIDALPQYQRDDWRGAAHALGAAPRGGRVLVGSEFASSPLSIYLGRLDNATAHQRLSTEEIDFIGLRVRRSTRPPLAPKVPLSLPPSLRLRLVAVRRTSSYAIARFLAPAPVTIDAAQLRRVFGEASADVFLQR